MLDLLGSSGGKVALVVLGINIALSAAKSILDLIEVTPEQKAASKLYQVVDKAALFLSKLVDWFSANKAH